MTLNELVNDALNNWALLITDTVVAIYTSRKDLMILKSLPLRFDCISLSVATSGHLLSFRHLLERRFLLGVLF